MKLSDHPGYMGGIGGVIAHCSDWPAYPFDGIEGLMFRLAAFAPGVKFVVIDDIEQAVLFAADVECAKLQKPMLEVNFHVAGWHEDLLELQSGGMISGLRPISGYRWMANRWKSMPRSIFEENGIDPDNDTEVLSKPVYFMINGNQVPYHPPNRNDYNEDDEPALNFPEFPNRSIEVTSAGRDWIHDSLVMQWGDWKPHLSPKVLKLFDLGFFDTCVREACVELEWWLKKELGSKVYGDRLVEGYLEHLANRKVYLESYRRTLRQDLRAVFKLIRNRYMHILADLDTTSALVNLIRIARIRKLLDINS